MLKCVAGHKAVRQENGCKGCPDVLTAISLDEDVGCYVVGHDHQANDSQRQELEIAGEQGDDKSTEEDVEDIEQHASDQLSVRSPN